MVLILLTHVNFDYKYELIMRKIEYKSFQLQVILHFCYS